MTPSHRDLDRLASLPSVATISPIRGKNRAAAGSAEVAATGPSLADGHLGQMSRAVCRFLWRAVNIGVKKGDSCKIVLDKRAKM